MAWHCSWSVDEDGCRIPGEPIHVYPDYGRAHDERDDCWCGPTPDAEYPAMLVHHAEH